MAALEILRPSSLDEATSLLEQYGADASVIAGGTAVVLLLKNRLITPGALLDVSRLDGLRYVHYAPGVGLQFGGLTTIREAECSPVVRDVSPALAGTFGEVASVRVRNAATVGGNLCEADYASDPPTMLVALRGRVKAVSRQRGTREIPLREFFTSFYETALAGDEILTGLVVPDLPTTAAATYLKFVTRSSEDRPCVGVAAVVDLAEDGACRDLRVVAGAVAETPQEFDDLEALARGQRLTDDLLAEIAHGYASRTDALADLRGSEAYRKRMVRVFVRRAVEAAAAKAESQSTQVAGGVA